jgi:hypothetical protein
MNLLKGILASTVVIAYMLLAYTATGAALQAFALMTITGIAYGMIAKAGR